MVVLTAILVVNAGSSSLKLRVLSGSDEVLASTDLPAPRGAADAAQLKDAITSLGPVQAAGHRIVHGGDLYGGPVLIDPGVRQRLGALTDLAPLHQPKSLAALDAVQAVLPDVPAVACFDTAFHAPRASTGRPGGARYLRCGRYRRSYCRRPAVSRPLSSAAMVARRIRRQADSRCGC